MSRERDMQDLIEQFNRETVPLLLKRWPEKFSMCGETPRMHYKCADGFSHWGDAINPESLDSLAAIAEACGFDTCAYFVGPKQRRRWYGTYSYFDGELWQMRHEEEIHADEPAARLAATIAAIAAVGGE